MGIGFSSKSTELNNAFNVEGGPLIAMLLEVIALIYAWLTGGVPY
jgi:hypothetical protein